MHTEQGGIWDIRPGGVGNPDVLPGQVLEEELRVGAGVRNWQGGKRIGQQRAIVP